MTGTSTRVAGRSAIRAMTALVMALGGCTHVSRTTATTTVSPSASAVTPTVRFLLVNDVYRAEILRDGSGGLARVAALRDSIEHATGSRVLYVLAGDVLSPSLLSKWYAGAQMVDAFNASRLDFATLGNHEFDGSRASLVARVAQSKFPWLGANCAETNGKLFPGVRGWDTVTVNGVRVGVFGTTIVTAYPAYVACRDADSVTHAVVDTLTRVKAQLIVGITHRNYVEDVRTLRSEPAVQAILGGHEHIGKRIDVDGRLVVKALSDARSAILMTFTLRNGKWEQRDTTFVIRSGMPEDATTAAVVARWSDTLARRIGRDRVIGGLAEALDGTDSTSHRGESVFGDFIADALRIGTKADVALINTGALRYDDWIAPGPVSTHTFESIFLFADETRAVAFNLTGARLREVLEHGVDDSSLLKGPYPQLSGVQFTYDPRLENGRRIVGPVLRANGQPIGDAETIRFTTVSFPACRNGDGYRFPEAADACKAMEANPDSAPRSAALVIQHIEGMGGQIVLPKLGRVRKVAGR